MRLFLLPYRPASASAKALAEAMGVKRCAHSRSTPNLRERTVINWGHSGSELSPYVLSNTTRVYNPPAKVAVAINKLSCLETLSRAGVNTPPFTTNIEEAGQWLSSGKEVVERHLLRGSGGDGIFVRSEGSDIQPAPLYTQYVKKKHEFRVHVINGQVADLQRKAKRADAEISDWKIRNLDAGFIFMRKGVVAPAEVIEQALMAVEAVDLDFGAVDVIYNAHEEKAYVLEINTACGLEGTTLEVYSEGLKAMISGEPVKDYTHWQEALEEVTEEDDIPPPQYTISPPQYAMPLSPVATDADLSDLTLEPVPDSEYRERVRQALDSWANLVTPTSTE